MLIVILSLTLLLVSSAAPKPRQVAAPRPRQEAHVWYPRIEEVERRELSGYARQEKRSEDLNDEEVPMIEEVVSVQIKKRETQLYLG